MAWKAIIAPGYADATGTTSGSKIKQRSWSLTDFRMHYDKSKLPTASGWTAPVSMGTDGRGRQIWGNHYTTTTGADGLEVSTLTNCTVLPFIPLIQCLGEYFTDYMGINGNLKKVANYDLAGYIVNNFYPPATRTSASIVNPNNLNECDGDLFWVIETQPAARTDGKYPFKAYLFDAPNNNDQRLHATYTYWTMDSTKYTDLVGYSDPYDVLKCLDMYLKTGAIVLTTAGMGHASITHAVHFRAGWLKTAQHAHNYLVTEVNLRNSKISSSLEKYNAALRKYEDTIKVLEATVK